MIVDLVENIVHVNDSLLIPSIPIGLAIVDDLVSEACISQNFLSLFFFYVH